MLTVLLFAAALADEPLFSGPQPGEKLPGFKVDVVVNAGAGKQIDPVREANKGPLVLVFVHELTRPAMQLIRPIDTFGDRWKKEGLTTHLVWLSSDRTKTEEYLKRAGTASLQLKSPASVYSGLEGPDNFGLNRKVTLTVLVAKDDKVTASFALIQPNETDAPKVLEAIARTLGKTPPTTEEIRAVSGPPRKPDQPQPDRDPMLQAMMRRMINLQNDAETCKKIADEMAAWAGADRTRRQQLREFAKQVLELGYGTNHAKQELKKLAE